MNKDQWRIDQDYSLRMSHRLGSRWTAEELAIALDYRNTAREAARLTGRTLAAVTAARTRHKEI